METTTTEGNAMFTDAYLFALASGLFGKGWDSIRVEDHLAGVCHLSRDHAVRITSQAFDPSQS